MTPALAQPSSSPQFSAVRQFYDAVAAWNFDDLDKLFSEDYVHTTHPASAKDAPKNKAQGIEHAKAVGAMFGHAPLKYDIFQFNETAGCIWVHSRLYGEIPGGFQFNSESVYIFTLSSGDDVKITAVQEYIDTKLAADFAASTASAASTSPTRSSD